MNFTLKCVLYMSLNGDCAKAEVVSYIDTFVDFGTHLENFLICILAGTHCTKNIYIYYLKASNFCCSNHFLNTTGAMQEQCTVHMIKFFGSDLLPLSPCPHNRCLKSSRNDNQNLLGILYFIFHNTNVVFIAGFLCHTH